MGLFTELFKMGLKSKSEYIDVTSSLDIEPFFTISKKVSIETDIDIQILCSSDNLAHIKCFAIKNIDDGDIKIKVDSKDDVSVIKISLSGEVKNCNIVLNLPSIKNLMINSKTSDVHLNKCKTDACDVTTQNGEILAQAVSFKSMDLNTKNGDISVFVNTVPIYYELHTTNGEKTVEKIKNNNKAKIKLKCFSGSGDILLKPYKS